jgi:hypothetical protein
VQKCRKKKVFFCKKFLTCIYIYVYTYIHNIIYLLCIYISIMYIYMMAKQQTKWNVSSYRLTLELRDCKLILNIYLFIFYFNFCVVKFSIWSLLRCHICINWSTCLSSADGLATTKAGVIRACYRASMSRPKLNKLNVIKKKL